MSAQRILIVGATGQQGGATIKALLSNSAAEHKILAVTRNPSSATAQKLATNPKVSLVKGDLDDCPAMFSSAGQPIDTALLVTLPSMKKHKPGIMDKETMQGRAFIDAAIASKVKHIVFTSVDRGGEERSWTNPTPIPHFITKYEIELYLREKTSTTNTSWTILRPAAFFDNYRAGFVGKIWAAVWAQMGEKRLQMVGAKDIGVIAAQALTEPERKEFNNQAIGIAGDELNQKEANEAMVRATGRPMVQTFGVIATVFRWALADFGTMIKWFETDGLRVDVEKCKKLNPGMMNFETWLREESQHK